ncbi:MAG: PIN domain-containing protein [Candidatus Azobacteroides sp.]|nr:PIN domain-containing protein [Candidatus Azobacteroides sp.]
MIEKYFFDSNIWLYLLLEKGSEKSLIAKNYIESSILKDQVVISWQVLNEVSVNLLKKGFTEEQISAITKWLCRIATVQDFTEEILLKASFLRQKYLISYWDSLIVAAALESNCGFLISEDMQNGQKILNLIIHNIFL